MKEIRIMRYITPERHRPHNIRLNGENEKAFEYLWPIISESGVTEYKVSHRLIEEAKMSRDGEK